MDDGDFGSSGYVRRLKRYEAAPTVVAQSGGLDFFSPFGPLIARSRLPAALVLATNDLLDAQIAAREAQGPRVGELTLAPADAQIGGEQSLASEVARRISTYLGTADDRPLTRVRYESFWMVRHFPGTFSPVHFHTGDVSGVMYLKVPAHIANEDAERRQSYVNARRAGDITFLIGGKQALSRSLQLPPGGRRPLPVPLLAAPCRGAIRGRGRAPFAVLQRLRRLGGAAPRPSGRTTGPRAWRPRWRTGPPPAG